jgi:HlyD family secretion protein
MRTSRQSLRRIVTWALVGLAGLALVVWATRPQPVPADVGVVQHAPLVVTLDQEGRTRVRRRYLVSAPVAGRLLRVDIEPGDAVASGAVVAVLRPDEAPLLDARARATAEARVRTADAGVVQAEAALEQAREAARFADRELERMEALLLSGAVSARERDAAEAEAVARARSVDVAEANLATAHRERDVAQAALAPGRDTGDAPVSIRAPVDGVVLRRLLESETVVRAGEALVEIGDLSHLEIVADYLSADAVRIEPGMPAIVERWGGGDPLRAVVRLIEPSGFVKISALGVEEQRVNVILDFDGPRERRAELGDGYRVEVRVVLFEADVLTVPASALFRQGEGWAAFVIGEDGTARTQPVGVGQRTGTLAEVRAGLDAGARVVLHPSDRVVDGVSIEAR